MKKLLFLSAAMVASGVATFQIVNRESVVGICGPGIASDCYDIDACSPDLTCRPNGTVWQTTSPSGKKLHKSGPVTTVLCKRLVWDNNECSGDRDRSDYNSQSCGVNMPTPGTDPIPD